MGLAHRQKESLFTSMLGTTSRRHFGPGARRGDSLAKILPSPITMAAGANVADIFISYSREDTIFVDALILALIEYGWTVWSDKGGMAEGRPFDQQIEDAMVKCSVALVIWSRGSVKSRWVRAEAAFALDKDKLVPVMADETDPPLQFLHIHGVSMAKWNRTTEDTHFKNLALMLSQRLDRVGRAAQPEKVAADPPKPETRFGEAASAWKNFREICFPAVGPGFSSYFGRNTFFVTQFCAIFGFCTVILFGLIDVVSKSDRAEQTQYRFMVTGPLMLLILALSFTPYAKRHSQTFAFVFACTTLLTNLRTIFMAEGKFPVTTGAATASFMVITGIFMILPFRVGYAAILGAILVLTHEIYIRMAPTPVPAGLHAGYTICVLTLSLALVVLAYFRDRVMRERFTEYDQLSTRNVELKERLMALAAQRNQPRDTAPGQQTRQGFPASD